MYQKGMKSYIPANFYNIVTKILKFMKVAEMMIVGCDKDMFIFPPHEAIEHWEIQASTKHSVFLGLQNKGTDNLEEIYVMLFLLNLSITLY